MAFAQPPVHFLIVEDDEVDIMTIQRAFEKNRVSNGILVARDGIEALEVLRSTSTDLRGLVILLDLNMPRMNGIDFLHALRADPDLRAATVVVFTTSGDEQNVIEAYQLNVAGYLRKPVQFQDFVDVMQVLHKYWMLVEKP